MTDDNVTTASVGGERMAAALNAYDIDPVASLTTDGARDVIHGAARSNARRDLWAYWALEGCDRASRWERSAVVAAGIPNSRVTVGLKAGRLLAACGERADGKTKDGKTTVAQAAIRVANDWDAEHIEALVKGKSAAALASALLTTFATLSKRQADGLDAYGVAKTTTPVPPAPDADAAPVVESVPANDTTRSQSVENVITAITGPVDTDRARTILAHALRVAIASGLDHDDVMAEVSAAFPVTVAV